jgi:hypothetical protein
MERIAPFHCSSETKRSTTYPLMLGIMLIKALTG